MWDVDTGAHNERIRIDAGALMRRSGRRCGEILGLGMTHYPGMTMQGQPARQDGHERPATAGEVPQLRHVAGADEARVRRRRGRGALERAPRAADRELPLGAQELDAFNPDIVLVWGDDQYENFKEDIVPPFSVLAYEGFDVQPWAAPRRQRELLGEGAETRVPLRGRAAAGQATWRRVCWRTASTSRTPTSPTA